MMFNQMGQDIEISKKITKTTTSRELKWDGQTYTKASEVEEHLETIFGAKRQAISNAVFIPQGALDKLLFGLQSEREKLLIKLVNVAHLSRIENVFDGKLKALSSQVEDFSTVKIAAMEKLEEATDFYNLAVKTYEDNKFTEESTLNNVERCLSLQNTVETLKNSIIPSRTELERLNLDRLSIVTSEHKNTDEIRKTIEALQTLQAPYVAQKAAVENDLRLTTLKTTAINTLTGNKKRLEALEKELEAIKLN